MIITKKALPRRTVLRGMGATLALPFLDAMVPALALSAQARRPVDRLLFAFIPMGATIIPLRVSYRLESMHPSMDKWTPPGEGMLV